VIRGELAQTIQAALEHAVREGALPECDTPPISIERPKNPEHGDYSSNIGMLLARGLHKPPIEVAQTIASHISHPGVSLAKVAAPGFINLRLDPDWIAGHLPRVLAMDERFGETDIGRGKRALVEYVSANPNGPLTLGHGRNGVIGDVLARCLRKAGWEVETEFYLNDSAASLQMQLFGESVRARYLQLLGYDVSLPDDGYKGEYLVELAKAIREKYGDSLAEGDHAQDKLLFKRLAEQEMRDDQAKDIEAFRLHFDHFVSEQKLHDDGLVEAAVAQLREHGYAYDREGAVWFRSTDFGDDKDRPLVRSTGEPTYIAADAAYHKNKYDRGYDLMIDVWGADHHGYVPRMKAVVAAMGYDPDKLQLLIYQLVRLWRGKDQVRMSTRAGEMITLREVLDEVGVDVARFFFLMRSHDTALDFDLELAKKRSDENPVYYVQYAHARICSILRKAELEDLQAGECTPGLLTDPAEVVLELKLLELPDEVERVVVETAPHRLTTYSQDLARLFHLFYDRCRVVDPANPERSRARLTLCQAVRVTLRNSLELMGVSAPERMEKETDER